MLAARGGVPESPDEDPVGVDDESSSRPADEDGRTIEDDEGRRALEDDFKRGQQAGGELSPDTPRSDSVQDVDEYESTSEVVSAEPDAGPGDPGDSEAALEGLVLPERVSVDQEKQDALGRVHRFPKDVARRLYRRLLRDCGPLEADASPGGGLYNEAEAILDAMDDLLCGDDVAGLAFDQLREGVGDQAIRVDTGDWSADESPVWFVGDLHGDLVALEYALQFIRSRAPDAIIVFLGDLIDDGGFGAQVVLRVFQEIGRRPGKICVIAGNHDEALHVSEGRFTATVSPCEFSEWLNRYAGEDPVVSRLGETFVRFVQQIPRSLFFDDGLLVAHGGIPLFPDEINSFDDLNSSECLQDFVWTRAHPRARRRKTHRQYLGCGFGIENFAEFSRRMLEVCGQSVTRMIRGHDHITDEARFDLYSRWQDYPMLTINTMCRRLEREMTGPFVHQPCVAEWIPDGIPRVYPLRIRDKIVRKFYEVAVAEEASQMEPAEVPPTETPPESSVADADS